MKAKGPDWTRVIQDLAQHLARASDEDQIRRIIADADRDVARLEIPGDFWTRLRASYAALPKRTTARPESSSVVELVTKVLAGKDRK